MHQQLEMSTKTAYDCEIKLISTSFSGMYLSDLFLILLVSYEAAYKIKTYVYTKSHIILKHYIVYCISMVYTIRIFDFKIFWLMFQKFSMKTVHIIRKKREYITVLEDCIINYVGFFLYMVMSFY